VLDCQPFNPWNPDKKNRAFFWDKLDESEHYNLIYNWEKLKYGEDKSNSYGIMEEEILT